MDDWLSKAFTASTASTASTAAPSTLTLDDIRKAIDVIRSLPPEPFRQMMVEAGKPPEQGYELHLPVQLKQQFPDTPHYVKFSRAAHQPTIVPSFNIRTFRYD